MLRGIGSLSVVVGAVAAFVTPSAKSADDSEWEWRLTPLYYWSLNLDGGQSAGASNPPIVLDDFGFRFEGAFSANFEGIYQDRWGFVADMIGVDLSSGNAQRNSRLNFSYRQAELNGYYRLPVGGQSFDLLFGLRYYDIDFALFPGATDGARDWVDPIVGGRWNWPLSEEWSLSLRGDVGGFGIGSALAWQVVALADYRPWTYVSLTGGLRAIGLDFSSGVGPDQYASDISVWGPIVGVSIRW